MSDTIEHAIKLEWIRSELQLVMIDLVLTALFCLNFPFVLAQKVMGYAKGTVIKILEARMLGPVNFAIRQISKLKLELFKFKVSLEGQLRKTMRDIREAHWNLVIFNFEFPDPWLFCILGFKSQMITMFLVFHGLVSSFVNCFDFALRRIASFIYSEKMKNQQKLRVLKAM